MYEDIEGYPKILFFSSDHCAPCVPIENLLKKININMFGKKLVIEKINIEKKENINMIKKFTVTSVPTLVIADKKISVDVQEEDIVDAILSGFISSIEL
ncbi:MAG: thioredoxin family protein [Candidatus Lokiarchaeota archaeon]|nr:thioredoxin family protein [Candidatus Lokiarchaeota archaeon]